MSSGLYLSALLLGLSGGAHCVGMCGSLGGALCGGVDRTAFKGWNLARMMSYAIAGLAVGGGSAWIAGWSQRLPAVHALWMLMQLTALSIALVLLLRPQWFGWAALAGQAGWQPVHWPAQPAVGRARWRVGSGLLWAGFPCGLLHAALLMAFMSGSALDGFFIMLLFGAASTAWLLAGSALIRHLRASARWSDLALRRVTGAALLMAWVIMAFGGGHAGQGTGLFCVPGV